MLGSRQANDAFPAHYGSLRARDGARSSRPEAAAEKPEKGQEAVASSMAATIVNVSKGIIGSGMLALPVALHNASVVPGMTSLALFAIVAGFSYALIGYCCAATGSSTYSGLWSVTVGSSSEGWIRICILLDNVFTLWAYSTLVGDFLGKAFDSLCPGVAILQNRAVVLGVLAVCIFAPFCLQRTLDSLKYTSALGLAATVYSLLYVCADYFVSDEGIEHFAENAFSINLVLFKSIALYAFAFLTHYSAPQVYSELADRSVRRFNIVTAGSFTAAFVVYAMFAACGYGRWGLTVEGNVLKNYGGGSKAVLFMWVAMALNVIFSYPLIFATLKENIYGFLGEDEKSASAQLRMLIVVLGVSSTVTLGVVFEDASLVMGICGAVVSSAIQFIFPALIYLHLPDAVRAKGYGLSRPLQVASYILIFVGVVACVVGTGATVADALS